jgi:predicted MPP superfamily phosphohydrolase
MTRALQMTIFLGIFAIILALAHIYLFKRISYYLQLNASQERYVALLLGSLGILTLIALPVSRILPREAATVLEWAVFPWMGFLLLMLTVMLATDMTWYLLMLTSSGVKYNSERRMFLQHAFGLAALGATGLLGGFALWEGLRPVKVKPITIILNRLPKSLDGLRIVQITDLHIDPMVRADWLNHVVDKVNELKPDLIAVTGDLVDGSVQELSPQVASLAKLAAPLGVYFITGNHEYYSGVESWCAHLAGLGLRVLRNERVTIVAGKEGDSFDLAGVDDWRSHQFPGEGPNLPKALAHRDPNKALVLLAHQPAAIHEAAEHGVDLQLSGHTHGGQIWPFKYLVYLQQPYVEGLHRHAETMTQIYVSPGTGYWGPPMRLGTAAEITHITLRAHV